MRFVLAIICFVLAAASMGLGIAQRTILAGPDEVSVSTAAATTTPVVVIDGSALNAYPHTQTVQLTGGTKAFAAYGRTGDVIAWVGDASYTRVTFNAKTGKLVSKVISGKTSTVPDPAGSDLWLAEYSGASAREFHLNVPSSLSLIAVSDGTAPAPSKVTLTWPIDNSTPWSGPLIVAGAAFLLLGLIFLLWALTHLRRNRGPRRSQPRMPKLPRQPRYRPSRQKALTASKGRRSISRSIAVVPAFALTAVLLAGCGILPDLPNQPTPTPTATAKTAETSKLQATAVTPDQLQTIVKKISTVTAQADAKLNKTLIATRVSGPALQERLANYTVRKADSKQAPALAIPSDIFRLELPQASNVWPRSVFTVVQSSASKNAPYVALMLVQDDPRSNYKVNYAVSLEANTKLPPVAGSTIGASRMSPDIGLLTVKPSALALSYGSILMRDSASPSYSLFQAEGDTLRSQVGLKAKKAAQKKLPSTAKLTYAVAEGLGQVIALATNDSGAIVAVNLNETETVRPVKDGAAVSVKGGAIKALSGKSKSTKGLVATYGDQLLFYVPSASVGGKIVLLGYSQGLISAAEYKKKK